MAAFASRLAWIAFRFGSVDNFEMALLESCGITTNCSRFSCLGDPSGEAGSMAELSPFNVIRQDLS